MVDLPNMGARLAGRVATTRLTELTGFAPDPGRLRGHAFVPQSLRPDAALVVALHGCTQDAAGYDAGTGWSTLAEREGFAVLFPEQGRGNNPNGCFNWFEPADIARTGGEAESIASMVEALVARHAIDPRRVFVTGLSAGGAMVGVMLATRPDLFAGGAIIGGLPYGCASSVPEALGWMHGRGHSGDAELTGRVRAAAGGYRGPWPRVSIWHGTADRTVVVGNMDRIGRQWLGVHGIDPAAVDATERGDRWTHRTWRGADGHVAVEEWQVDAMGHGVPIDPNGPDRLGAAGAYMLDVGLASTAVIARSWGLATEPVTAAIRSPAPLTSRPAMPHVAPRPANDAATDVGRVIENALRSAGLLR